MSLLAVGLASLTLGIALIAIQLLTHLFSRTPLSGPSSAEPSPEDECINPPAKCKQHVQISHAIFSLSFWDIFLLLLGLSILATMILSMSRDIAVYLPGFIVSFICGLCAYVYRY